MTAPRNDSHGPLIQCNELTVVRGGEAILDRVSFEIGHNQLVCVFGPNGAGKSTLLKVLIGQISPDSGSATIEGAAIKKKRSSIGYVAQGVFSRPPFPITVGKAVLLGRCTRRGLFRRFNAEDRRIVSEALSQVGLEGFEDRALDDLSGGQRQRVFIARALAGEPSVLFLDEATSGVDIGAKEGLFDLLTRLKQRMTVVFVTHDVSVVSDQVDLILCLNRSLVSHGRPAEALTDEALHCMYGHGVALFGHCHVPHIHVERHDD